MKMYYLKILLFAATSALLIGGCEKQNAENTPETVLNLAESTEDRIEVEILSETIDSTSSETAIPASEAASTSESKPQDTTPEAPKTDSATPTTQRAENLASADTVNVTKAFQPNDGWTSDFFFQIPKNWSYTVDEDTFEWGFLIQVDNQEDASIRIYGQQGTVNVEQFYANAPTDFETAGGLKGKFYQEKRTSEDTSYVEGDIVFDLKLYGVHFYMPENVYQEYKDTLQTIFLSIKIEDIIAE